MSFPSQNVRTVYIVEDETPVRDSLCELLQSHGFCCHPFASAEEFLASYDEAPLACLITDHRMPGMSGAELQAVLVARRSLLPVIFVSGFADVPVAVSAMKQGAVTLLQKPYDRGELLAAVETALALAAERRHTRAAAGNVAARLARLSPDELQVMELLVEGQPNKSISKQLDIGLRTVERRRQQVLEKMDVGSLPELAALLVQHRKQQAER